MVFFEKTDVLAHRLMRPDVYGPRVMQNKQLAGLKLTPAVQEEVAKAAFVHDVALLERACAGQMFEGVSPLRYEGPDSLNPLSFKAYDPDYVIDGKTLRDHLRISVAFWHAFRGNGADPFGGGTISRPWDNMHDPLMQGVVRELGAFELMKKIGFPFWAFHDYDLIDGNGTLKELDQQLEFLTDIAKNLQEATGIKLAWTTSQFFALPIYMEGAATSPFTAPFLRAVAQGHRSYKTAVKLNGENHVYWGGREGLTDLINTRPQFELDNLALFLRQMAEMGRKMGFNGQNLIEPKTKEPTKHQYDRDVTTVRGFLDKHGLQNEFLINFEPNHGMLSGLSAEHELAFAGQWLGSFDINTGDHVLGWDVDYFTDPETAFQAMRTVTALRAQGGFRTGVMNIDAKVRRTSTDFPGDLLHGMIKTADLLTTGLMQAKMEAQDGRVAAFNEDRYAGWTTGVGKQILAGEYDGKFGDLAGRVVENESELVRPIPSGRIEMLHNMRDQATTIAPIVKAFRGVRG